MKLKATLRRFQAVAKDAQIVYRGFRTLRKTKRTPEQSYLSMRNLFVSTNGRSNDIISRLISNSGYADINFKGVLGLKSKADLEQAINSIKQNGYHVFEQKLSDEMVDQIFQYASTTSCRYITANGAFSDEAVIFDERNPLSPRYQFTQQQILENDGLLKLIFDPSLLAVAQGYLGAKPLLDLIAMWWSAPFHGISKSEAAQLYHFDLDRIKFLKFFFYLTDVDPNTGPHCYVKSSHKRLPLSLLKDGRLTDEEVEAGFGRDNMIEICGSKGTILAVDTRGLHKGKELTKDKRLLFQIEFANSMFGQYYPPCKKPVLQADLEKQFQKYKYSYQELIA